MHPQSSAVQLLETKQQMTATEKLQNTYSRGNDYMKHIP